MKWITIGYLAVVITIIILVLYFCIVNSVPVYYYVPSLTVFVIGSAYGLKYISNRIDGAESVELKHNDHLLTNRRLSTSGAPVLMPDEPSLLTLKDLQESTKPVANLTSIAEAYESIPDTPPIDLPPNLPIDQPPNVQPYIPPSTISPDNQPDLPSNLPPSTI